MLVLMIINSSPDEILLESSNKPIKANLASRRISPIRTFLQLTCSLFMYCAETAIVGSTDECRQKWEENSIIMVKPRLTGIMGKLQGFVILQKESHHREFHGGKSSRDWMEALRPQSHNIGL
ncbi:hypothetical protein BTUL_0009g01110 [Botrytis tulipae]|uniref:Uncharacterized protein n=1 Tax=Botrytis tulipae TaxID=87230 RepID=A0A4Z1FAW3_9HELO|nr:hypothetical protein BTUL_0009g01110 [Botrytis tulipae]